MVEDEHAVSAGDIFQQLLGFSVIGLADFFFLVEIFRGALMVDKRKALAVEREGPGTRTRIMNGDAVRFGDNVGFRDARRRIEGIDPRTLAQGRRVVHLGLDRGVLNGRAVSHHMPARGCLWNKGRCFPSLRIVFSTKTPDITTRVIVLML